MVRDRIHLLELSHVDITEATSFGSGSCDLSTSGILKHGIRFRSLLRLLLFLGAHSLFDPRSIVTNTLHQLATLFRHIGFVIKLELEGWRYVGSSQALTRTAWSVL